MTTAKAERITRLFVRRIDPSLRSNHYGIYADEGHTQLLLEEWGREPKEVLRRLVEANYKRVQKIVFDRDRWRCTHCGSMRNLTTHHLVKRSHGRLDVPENLTTLDALCHEEVERGRIKL